MKEKAERDRLKRYREIWGKSGGILGEAFLEMVQKNGKVREGMLAAAMNFFVLWMLKRAEKDGVKRLYFLARDGYFMYRCAEVYCRRLKLPIECRYLCCSRYSLRLPLFHLDMEAGLSYICRGGINVTMEKILSRAGLEEKEREQVLRRLGMWEHRKQEIPYARLGKIRERLKKCPLFLNYMYLKSRKAYPALEGYLRQEGLTEEGKAAVADSGWVGSMQMELNRVLAKLGRREGLTGYYWGLYELPEKARREDYCCCYFSPERGIKRKVYFSNCLFEAIYTAPHGMTSGYEKKGETYVPVYEKISPEKKKFLREMEKEILWIAETAAENGRTLFSGEEKKAGKAAEKCFRLFMGKPTYEEAEFYGSLKFSDDVLGKETMEVAARLNRKELRKNHGISKILSMLGKRKNQIRESAWYEGSAARRKRAKHYHWLQYRIYKYLLYLRKSYYYNRTRRRLYGKEKQGTKKAV